MAAQGDRVLLEDDAGLRWWTPATGETGMVERATGHVSVVDAELGGFDALAAGAVP